MKNDRGWIPGEADLDWIESISPPLEEAFSAIETAAEPHGIPIVDRHTGRVLAALAAGRRRIVEVGTAYGYSTLWLSTGQPTDGTITTIDPDIERTARARMWWRQAGVPDDRIVQVSAPALDAFADGHAALAGPFDLAFIDALKPEYDAYLDALIDGGRLAPGALVVADNVLWSGRAAARPVAGDEASTQALRAFSSRVLSDPRFVGTILPVGDGLLVAGWHGSPTTSAG